MLAEVERSFLAHQQYR